VNSRYWSRRYALRGEGWSQYREALALALDSPDHWSAVNEAFQTIGTLELQASRQRSDDPLSRPPLDDFGRGHAERGVEVVGAAIRTLEPLARGRAHEEPIDGE
jgi:hypothetical protein